jgi:CRP/FNR family transcriptional regulator, cyclic AMP receptor protein
MNSHDASIIRVVRLLEVDPDLGETLSDDARRAATDLIQVRVAPIAPGAWTPPLAGPADTGLLVLDGLMVRKVRVGTSSSTEVIGPTDLLRPGDQESLPRLLPDFTEWRVLQDCRLAVLDARVTAAIGRWPALTAAVCARFLRRSRSLAYLMAAQHFTRVTDRLLATLWHMASRWGRVTPHGTVLPFRLTHEMLGEIIGARRPTTTQAVSALERRGLLLRDEKRRLVLLGAPDISQPEPAVGEVVMAASA